MCLKGRDTEPFCVLTSFLNCLQQLKPGAQNSVWSPMWVSGTPWRGPSAAPFQSVHWQECWAGSRGRTWTMAPCYGVLLSRWPLKRWSSGPYHARLHSLPPLYSLSNFLPYLLKLKLFNLLFSFLIEEDTLNVLLWKLNMNFGYLNNTEDKFQI